MSPSPSSKTASPFVSYLKGLAQREDRGALAALRRGLGQSPGSAPEMHPYVARFLPPGDWTWRHQCHYIVAALFALHQQSADRGNMGDTFRRIGEEETKTRGDKPESLERRFVALLKCHRDDLFGYLRHAVSLAGSRNVPVNWERLLSDLHKWNYERRPVQRDWARSFWGGRETDENTETQA